MEECNSLKLGGGLACYNVQAAEGAAPFSRYVATVRCVPGEGASARFMTAAAAAAGGIGAGVGAGAQDDRHSMRDHPGVAAGAGPGAGSREDGHFITPPPEDQSHLTGSYLSASGGRSGGGGGGGGGWTESGAWNGRESGAGAGVADGRNRNPGVGMEVCLPPPGAKTMAGWHPMRVPPTVGRCRLTLSKPS